MNTPIDLLDEIQNEKFCIIEENIDNLPTIILDLEQDISTRLKALNLYSTMDNNNIVELLSRINCMYQMSGIKTVETYLYNICTNSNLPSILKLSAVKSLIEYKELIDEEDSEEEIERINNSNLERSENARKALEILCNSINTLPTPCRVEAIQLLMTYESSKDKANEYFILLINDQSIECEFRYKTILSIEKLAEKWMKDKLLNLFNTSFSTKIFNTFKHKIKTEFPGFKPESDNYDFFEMLILGLSNSMCHSLCQENNITSSIYDFYISQAQYSFLFYPENMIYYKILAGQYLLQKYNIILTTNHISNIENEILSFARDIELDYNRRADAADVLLQLGSSNIKLLGRQIINELGIEDNTQVKTIFSNTQNVHTMEVEESVLEILEFLETVPNSKKPIEFNTIQNKIKDYLKTERQDSQIVTEREKNIMIALNRIQIDRVLYSKYNNTLSNILIKIWTYILNHEHEEEMYKRLLEELEEMSGTCSTGFVSRLVNVISGFGKFNMRISWEDQITANFAGRINAFARNIINEDSIFRNTKLDDIIDLWLKLPEQKIDKLTIINKLKNVNPTSHINTKDIVNMYLSENKQEKIENAIDYFSSSVLEEMSLSTLKWDQRLNFGLFFRSVAGQIREEMYREFTEYLDDTSFDLYMRKALMNYEGIV